MSFNIEELITCKKIEMEQERAAKDMLNSVARLRKLEAKVNSARDMRDKSSVEFEDAKRLFKEESRRLLRLRRLLIESSLRLQKLEEQG